MANFRDLLNTATIANVASNEVATASMIATLEAPALTDIPAYEGVTLGLDDNIALADESWTRITDRYIWYDEFDDSRISIVDEMKNITLDSHQINLSQEELSQYILFEMPRRYDNFDLALNTRIQFHYVNGSGFEDYATAVNVHYSLDKIRFALLVPYNMTYLAGNVNMEIIATGTNSKGENYKWISRHTSFNVEKSLIGNGIINPTESDWYTQFVRDMDAKLLEAQSAKDEALAAAARVDEIAVDMVRLTNDLNNELGIGAGTVVVESYNLLNTDYSENGYSYSNGFLSNMSVNTTTGELSSGGTRYVTHPIKIKENCKIFVLVDGDQSVKSIIGVLQYSNSGEFVQFINNNGLNGVNVETGIIRIIVAAQSVATNKYIRVSTEEYKDSPYQKYFEPEEQASGNGLIPLNVNYEVGLFNGVGENASVNYDAIRLTEHLSTSEKEMLFIYIKNGYDLIINDIPLTSATKQNIIFSNHLSYITDGRSIRVGARKHDKSSITDAYEDVLKVYKVKTKFTHECYDLCIAGSDSPKIYKNKADIVCDGKNDQFVLQCAMYNFRNSNKVLLYPGNYYITEVRDNPYSADGLYGKKVVFLSQNPTTESVTNVIHVEGYMRHIIQQDSIMPVTIKFTEECWNSIAEDGEQVSVLGGEYRNFYQRRLGLHLSCINFRGYDAKKPVVFVDGYYSANMQIEKVNVMSEATTFGAYTYMPNEKHNGFRGTQGSPYGTNYIRNCLAWKCGIGYNIGGEHFVLEDAGACFCGIGFAFSHYYGRIRMQHNNIMIKCVVSQCMRSILLDRYGLSEDSADELKNSTQMLECIGLQLESSFTTEGLSEYGYEDGHHNTEGVYEVHDGAWYGTITLQTIAKAVEKGCKNMKVTIIMLPIAGTLSERPPIYKVANYTEFYDVENNVKYIAYGGEWKALN